MGIFDLAIKATSLLLNFVCIVSSFFETIAFKFRLSPSPCYCSNCQANGCSTRIKRRRKSHGQVENCGPVNGTRNQLGGAASDVKRIKLLLDITLNGGSKVLDVQACTRHEDEMQDFCSGYHCDRKPGFLWNLINLPSSIVLCITGKVVECAQHLEEALHHTTCDDPNRVKKSPKRRISRANYRRILPFFPFNLLGFSNYSAFQMPTLTRSEESQCNLNVSVNGNGKVRCKRRRDSSTGDEQASFSSISDNESKFVMVPENTKHTTPTGGHDVVDSDETGDTVTKQVSSSSSSSGKQNETIKFKCVKAEAEPASNTDLDNSGIGSEEVYVSTVLQELDEAANDAYNSGEDPDYKPDTSSTTDDSSFQTDSCVSDESFLGTSVATPTAQQVPTTNGVLLFEGPSPPTHEQEQASTGCDDEYYNTPEEEYHETY